MDYLREGIHLRGFAQIDPLVAYKNEAFTLFEDLMNSIWSDFARMVYNVEVQIEGEAGDAEAAVPDPASSSATGGATALSYSGGTLDDQPSAYGEPYGVEDPQAGGPAVVQQRRLDEAETVGRNEPCWCGSGKKFKKCHGA
jgi:preprotein translocase subunit SecA